MGWYPGTSTVSDNTVTNAKLGTDVKVGSLAALTTTVKTSIQAAINELVTKIGALSGLATTEKGSVVGAINELVTSIGAKYTLPLTGIPATSMAAAVQTSLGKADTAYQLPVGGMTSGDMSAAVQASLAAADAALASSAAYSDLKAGTIQLNGVNPSHVNFGAASAAVLTGTNAQTFNMATDGLTLIVNTDGAGDDTATFNCAAGYLTGGNSCATDMTTSVDTKFKIAVDGGAYSTVTCDWVAGSCDSGAEIATEMQTKIQALGGAFAAVTVSFVGGNHLLVTSGTKGTGSSVAMDHAADHDCLDELDLGTNAVATAGTGDFVNAAVATAAEVVAVLNADLGGLDASVDGSNHVVITSKTTGRTSSLVVNAGSTADTILGITGSAYGGQGLGYAAGMSDTNYRVSLVLVDDTSPGSNNLGIANKTASGFDVYCETSGATEHVDIVAIGAGA